ncbi:MAG: IS21-like element helper ATPase IstB [Desulfobacteraceae bacterium]|nr:IS21-like element helper ATPase IstB [Desulfobacteraceae bacterium]
MNAATKAVLKENLQFLKLSTIMKNLENINRQALEAKISYTDFLLNLTQAEVNVRKENGRKRRIREASFSLHKPLETFEFEAAPDLDARFINDLASGSYIKQNKNIIFLGKSGTGKTHLATALGIEACDHGVRTKFITGCGLVNELTEARDEKRLRLTIKRYFNYGLLIIDELGYVPFSKEGAELLFQVLAERHERKPIIITTNKGFGDWTEIFGDPSLTAALLDRVTHKAHVINCSWQSYRLSETLKQRKK